MYVTKSLVFHLKFLLVIVSLITYLLPHKPYPYLISILSLSLLMIRRELRVLALIGLNTALLLTLLMIASLISGLENALWNSINYSLYVLTALSAIIYVALTTKPSEIEEYLRVKGLARLLSLMYSLREEIVGVYETFKARGFEVSLNFMKTVPPLISILMNTIDRIMVLEESLKARGSEVSS